MCFSERLSKTFGLGIAAIALGIGLASVFAVDTRQEINHVRSRKQIELDLSYARLEERIVKEGMDVEDARDAIARWHIDNQAELSNLREEAVAMRLAQKQQQAVPSLPTSVPDLGVMGKREFSNAAEQYFRKGWDACSSDEQTGGNPEKARDNYSEWMEQAEQQNLAKILRKTQEEIWEEEDKAIKPEPILSEEELAKLDPKERIREEIYTRLLALYAPPLADNEEDRDRMGQIQNFHKAKLKELSEIDMQLKPARAEARVKNLEEELANTPDQ